MRVCHLNILSVIFCFQDCDHVLNVLFETLRYKHNLEPRVKIRTEAEDNDSTGIEFVTSTLLSENFRQIVQLQA